MCIVQGKQAKEREEEEIRDEISRLSVLVQGSESSRFSHGSHRFAPAIEPGARRVGADVG